MFKMIRAGAGYNPVILITPADAGYKTPGAQYFELSPYKDGHRGRAETWKVGAFNEINEFEAMTAFQGFADAWGFEELARPHFPTLDDALAWVIRRRGGLTPIPEGHWFFSYITFDRMENDHRARSEERRKLKATSEGDALHEAQLLWAEQLERGTRRERDKKIYPQCPRVFYEVPWPTHTE